MLECTCDGATLMLHFSPAHGGSARYCGQRRYISFFVQVEPEATTTGMVRDP
jgi:hypothetical protein